MEQSENFRNSGPGQSQLRQRIRQCVSPLEAAAPAFEAQAPAQGDYDLNPEDTPSSSTFMPAAVLVPLLERDEGLTVLLTRRTDHLPDHPGQISFPGGRVESRDVSVMETALRETEEEIGLGRAYVEVVGLLDCYDTVTGYRITPVVGFVSSGYSLHPDPAEVAEVLEVPFAFLLDPGNRQVRHVTVGGKRRTFYAFDYGPHFIWGATAGMLVGFLRRLES